jgi:hypothetical protein
VAKTLIEEGIRQAIKDGFLKQTSQSPGRARPAFDGQDAHQG